MTTSNRQDLFQRLLLTAFIVSMGCFGADAKSRWSATEIIPDADFLYGGQFVLAAPVYFFQDTAGKSVIKPSGYVNFGPTEWVNIQAGYAGGFTLGFKARILGERGPFLPSIALGVHNIFSHVEPYLLSNVKNPDMDNELYIAVSRGFEPIKTRLHFGVQSILSQKRERFNPYFGIEKYFGAGVYVSLEVHRRAELFHPSLFLSWRFLKKRLELTVGAVSLGQLFMGDGSGFELAMDKPDKGHMIRPGFWVGLRYQGNIGNGEYGGLAGVEDRLVMQQATINKLSADIADLKKDAEASRKNLNKVDKSIQELTDTTRTQEDMLQSLIYSKVVALRAIHTAQPFEPEKAKTAMNEITAFKEKALPSLKTVVLNEKEDRGVRILAVTLLGEIGQRDASGAVMTFLTPTAGPDMKVEALISLGKMRETSAAYLMEQLANDPNDAVAYTAREVLRKLSRETGIRTSAGSDTANVARPASVKPVAAPQPKPAPARPPAADTAKAVPQSNMNAPAQHDTAAAPATAVVDTVSKSAAGTAASAKKPASATAAAPVKTGADKGKKAPAKAPKPKQPEDNRNW